MSGERTTTVLVGVTGGIAAYKSCELVRALMKRGYRVKVVMTEAATRFVTPLTFRTLTNEPVAASLWEDDPSAPVHHISLAEEADVFVIAPCTANVIAKIAQGRADDLLTTAALATEAPIVLAPAMNVHMWRDEATQENVQVLRDLYNAGIIPVVAPVGTGVNDNETFNVNGDTAAGAIAGALQADRLLLLTDVSGVKNKDGEVVTQMTPDEVCAMIADGTIAGGMIPKTETALKALEDGVRAVVILDGRVPNASLLELFTDHGAGSLIRSTEPRVKPRKR